MEAPIDGAAGPGADARPPPPTTPARDDLVRDFRRARDADDLVAMESIALRLPFVQQFGPPPGEIPALIHEVYLRADSTRSRCRLATAMARAWVYGYDAARASAFGAEAVRLADGSADPVLLADALDAALLTNWGPDSFRERVHLAERLADTAAHLTDVEARMTAYIWRLTTAWECLDVVAVQRQLRMLDLLAAESGSSRVAFYAASRRAAQALVDGNIEAADELIEHTRRLGEEAKEPDAWAVFQELLANRARQKGDVAVLRTVAGFATEFGSQEGVQSILAEAAVIWLEAGDVENAIKLLDQLAGDGFGTVPRDVDFLLTVTSLVQVAAAVGRVELCRAGIDLLAPFAGRAVVNAGAVAMMGVVDEYVMMAALATGDPAANAWRQTATTCYRRLGAPFWLGRISLAWEPSETIPAPDSADPPLPINFTCQASGGWSLGSEPHRFTLPDLKGLRYLRILLQRPGVEVTAGDLVAAVAGHSALPVSQPDSVADPQALAAYRRRLDVLDQALDEADAHADAARAQRLHDERAALVRELASATGLGGRARHFSSDDERARVAVRKAIAAAISRIEAHDARMGRVLRNTVQTGAACRYEPDPAHPVIWTTEGDPDPPT